MNRKNFIPLVGIAFGVAVISTWIFYGLVAGRFERAAGATARTVVVATRTLEAGSTVSAADLKSLTWTGADAPEGSFALPAQVVGGRVVGRVGENEPVTKQSVEVSEGGRAASGVPVGMRAISVRASDSLGLMPMLARASYVDIQAVAAQREGVISVRTILERVLVLEVRKPGEDGLGKGEAAVVTLLVAQADADRLAQADSSGKIRLALRNPDDQARSAGETPTVQQAATAALGTQFQMDVSLLADSGAAGEAGIVAAAQTPAGTPQSVWHAAGRNGAVLDQPYDGYRVRVALRSARATGKGYEALVEPEISWPGGAATEARRLRQTIAWQRGEKLVVRGLTKPDGSPAVLVITARGTREK